jgi:hypothetical protein
MIDHLVYATPQLGPTIAALSDRLGVTLAEGGQHLGQGTRNYLANLGGGVYLEVVGPDPDQPDTERARPFGIDCLDNERLVAWCARPDDLDLTIDRLRAAGHEPGAPQTMSRRRTDGQVLQWRLTMPGWSSSLGCTAPFLIDWLRSEHPTASLPEHMVLDALVLGHPLPQRVDDLMANLGSVQSIATCCHHRPSLEARLSTPHGPVSLRG